MAPDDRNSDRRAVTRAEFDRLAEAVRGLQHRLDELASGVAGKLSAAYPIEIRRHPGGTHVSLAWQEKDAYVELTGDLFSGSSAAAKILWHDGAGWIEADTEEITVHDATGTMEGLAGDRALVRFHRQSGLWLVWQLQC